MSEKDTARNDQNLTLGERKLAAIMFTDMKGYSRMMNQDEQIAIEVLNQHNLIMRETVSEFNGRVVKTIGDAFMVEFASAILAVRCSVMLQTRFQSYNNSVPAPRHISVRVGIHIGDVVVQGNDLFGEGVNIASRIESLAPPGGICITAAVNEQIKGLQLNIVNVGLSELKNIREKYELFHILIEGIPLDQLKNRIYQLEAQVKKVVAKIESFEEILRTRPTDEDVDAVEKKLQRNGTIFFGAAIVLAVLALGLTTLGYFNMQRVQIETRRSMDTLSLTVRKQLDSLLLSIRADAQKEETAAKAVQTTDAELSVFGTLIEKQLRGEKLSELEASQLAPRLTAAQSAAPTARGALEWLLLASSSKEKSKQIEYCTEAIKLKPDFSEAYTVRGVMFDEMKLTDKALADFSKAIELRPSSAGGFYWRGGAQLNQKQFAKAIEDFNAALSLQPDHADALTKRALANINLGKLRAAETDLVAALKLRPDDKDLKRRLGSVREQMEE